MSDPVISVLMSVYNSDRYLAPAVRSILTQTYRDFEFIIVNDGSTDRSLEILESFAACDGRIRLLSRGNTGVAAALHEALSWARGEFVARMDSDDVSLPERLELQLAFMREHPDCVALSCRELTIDPDGWPVRVQYCPLSHEEIDAYHLKGYGGALSGPSMFVRREALLAVRGFRAEYASAEDYDLSLKLAEVGRVANLPDVLFFYREHGRSLTRTVRERQRMRAWLALRDAHARRQLPFDKPPPAGSETETLDLETRWAALALGAGYYRTARKHAWRRLVQAPSFTALKVLLESAVRPVVEPLYDLLRGRRPHSRCPIPPAVVRAILKQVREPGGTSTAPRPERRAPVTCPAPGPREGEPAGRDGG